MMDTEQTVLTPGTAGGRAQGRLRSPELATKAWVPSCNAATMTVLMPVGTVARTVPKPTASTGLLRSQVGLLIWAVAEQSGMLMMLSEPGLTPSPAFATTSSLRVGAKSAQSGAVPTGMGLVAGAGT